MKQQIPSWWYETMSARDRREAYDFVANALTAYLRERQPVRDRVLFEVERIRDAMRAASEVVDGEGVGEALAAPDSNERGGGGL